MNGRRWLAAWARGSAALFGLLALLALLTLLATSPSARADDGAQLENQRLEIQQRETLLELSPYYSSIALLIPISNAAKQLASAQASESEVYQQLFAKSGRPNILLLEASIYPMPWLGTELRRSSPELYARDSDRLNLIPALTAGFQEPWALSAFIGNDMLYVRPGQPVKETNRGYMGYLLSVGNRHIVGNEMIDDNWLELEWKMKGERIFKEDRLSWSFRVGTRFHHHPDIADTFYLGVSRSSLDFNAPLLSWLRNTKVNILSEFLQQSGRFSRQELIFGKKLPVKSNWMAAWQIEFGVIYDTQTKYSGALAKPAADRTTLIIRPNMEF